MNDNNIQKINWFPGHMKKATDHLIKKLNDVDFVVEVLDARAIEATSNPDLVKLIKNKPLIKVALKSDLSDTKVHDGVLIGNIKDKNFRNKIISKFNELFENKINSYKRKGLVNFQFIGMVIGIPNVGKSSLINFLSSSKSLITENRAGVTKRQSIRKVNNNFFLIDTPGILIKKIDNLDQAYQLSILNNISKKVLPLYDVINYHYNYLKTHYESNLKKYFNIDELPAFSEFIKIVSEKYKFIMKQNEIDLDRTLEFLFKIFSTSTICPFHF